MDSEPTRFDVISNEEDENVGAFPSYVDLLRQDYKELSEVEDVLIPVQGYERVGLRAKYRLPESGKELDTIARKAMREHKDTFSRNISVAMDTIIVLCVGLYIQPANTEELGLESPTPTEPIPLDPENTGEPARYDHRLAEILGLGEDVNSARAVVRALFGNNDLAILAHSEKLSRWIANTKADLDAEFWQLGEGT
jgi:hypothetical protein